MNQPIKGSDGALVQESGGQQLKGFDEPVELFRLERAEEPA